MLCGGDAGCRGRGAPLVPALLGILTHSLSVHGIEEKRERMQESARLVAFA